MVIMAVGDNVIVRKDKPKEEIKSKSGIIVVQQEDEACDIEHGEVISVGHGKMNAEGKRFRTLPEIKVGMRIGFFNRGIYKNNKYYNPNETEEGEKMLVHVNVCDILYYESN